MHELAILQALMEQVESIALKEHAEDVTTIHLDIGPLSGVDPRLLEQMFFILRAGTIANDAELVIECMAVCVSCNECGKLSDALPSRLVCGHCGDWRTSLVSGNELQLRHVELARQRKDDMTDPEPALQADQKRYN